MPMKLRRAETGTKGMKYENESAMRIANWMITTGKLDLIESGKEKRTNM